MASKCSRLVNRSSISSLKSAIKSNIRTASPSIDRSATSSSSRFALPTRSTSSPLRRFSLSRSPSELGCVQSMLPLHSVVASARMTSCLSTTSRSCRALSQELGLSVPR
ncbi:protein NONRESPONDING TO OXYLIPINS 2, mitochondrial-like isoform X2 [Cornus florida]|uniref:protein NONRESPONDING TO OXYLIPINS 2, mitochondrial-like isoform X2 n=1 Tax=Cornus florida TaxID=4283 RepID=UPI0028A04087|nr:protein NONRESPONDING TO OXYLIPINS 2, mitochondrial-like isoform X2 [Cornus florida]